MMEHRENRLQIDDTILSLKLPKPASITHKALL